MGSTDGVGLSLSSIKGPSEGTSLYPDDAEVELLMQHRIFTSPFLSSFRRIPLSLVS